MDNDNKIVPQKDTVNLFLDNMDVKAVSEKEEYSLEEHFISSKKNKNWRILLILFVLVVVLVGASWGLTKWIKAKNTITNFELDEFQDVDFMDILNEVQKIEQELTVAEGDLVGLRSEYQKARQSIILKADQELKLLDSRDLSDLERVRGTRDLTARKERELNAVDEEYLDRITTKEEEITVIRERMAAYDSEKVQQAQEYENILANEQQKSELEKKQIIDEYEQRLADQEAAFQSRLEELTGFQEDLESVLLTVNEGRQVRLIDLFNPVLPEDREDLAGLMDIPVDENRFSYNLPDTDPLWMERGYLSPEELEYLQQSVGNWRALMSFLSSIPFQNAVPDILKQMEYRYLNTIDLISQKEIRTFEKLYQTETDLNGKKRELAEAASKMDTMVSANSLFFPFRSVSV